MSKKTEYTKEDIEEMKSWFDAQQLPQTLQINAAAFTPDLRKTVDMLLEQAFVCYENDKMFGCITLLEEIRDKLEQEKKQ